jgi:hypothetical protein
MVALSLERLGVLHPVAAAALFVLLLMFILGTELRKRNRHGEDR